MRYKFIILSISKYQLSNQSNQSHAIDSNTRPKMIQLELGNIKWHPTDLKPYQKCDKGLRLRSKSKWEGTL